MANRASPKGGGRPYTVSLEPFTRESGTFFEKGWSHSLDHSTWLIDHASFNPEEALIASEDSDDVPDDPKPRLDLGLLEKLPREEADLLTLYYVERKSQKDIAACMGCSQPAVSYAIQRAFLRVRWMLGPGSWFSSEEFVQGCSGALASQTLVLMGDYWRTTSQTATGLLHGMLQGRVRHAIHYGTGRLAAQSYEDRTYSRYALGFAELESWGQNLLWTAQQTNQLRKSLERPPVRWGRAKKGQPLSQAVALRSAGTASHAR